MYIPGVSPKEYRSKDQNQPPFLWRSYGDDKQEIKPYRSISSNQPSLRHSYLVCIDRPVNDRRSIDRFRRMQNPAYFQNTHARSLSLSLSDPGHRQSQTMLAQKVRLGVCCLGDCSARSPKPRLIVEGNGGQEQKNSCGKKLLAQDMVSQTKHTVLATSASD